MYSLHTSTQEHLGIHLDGSEALDPFRDAHAGHGHLLALVVVQVAHQQFPLVRQVQVGVGAGEAENVEDLGEVEVVGVFGEGLQLHALELVAVGEDQYQVLG